MEHSSKIYVAGHRGMAGSAITRKLREKGYNNIIAKTSKELDLRDQKAVHLFFETERPEYVFLAAAKVGGIVANNTYRGEFLYDNLIIEANVIHAAKLYDVKKLLFLGSSCIYPKLATQPMNEDALLTGSLEYTNEPYAIAKIAGIKLCESYYDQFGCNFIAAMPTNLYGPGDNYHLQNSHVVPALIRKFHEAKVNGTPVVEIWGSGRPLREFMYVDDLADGCVFLMLNYDQKQFINIGTGEEVSIMELASLVKEVVGFEGDIKMDATKPDGTPRKLMDSSRIKALGWRHQKSLAEGLKLTYDFFRSEDVRS
ncbi:GDP-L-fucose synthase family protein [Polluticoccus soli]|uniref:GDP-L-fucose synthase family protein n=1 Tax=Polluticoccus soli TaxID=3034150 RepID=UPI0023E33AA6|nr:GDP-L-fucose synthase [Flavipsychrobacter sp. JY13-12]